MQLITVRLSDLVCADRIDPRRTGKDVRLDALKASIAADGLLQPPIVRSAQDDDAKFEIVAGNRRVRAIREIAGAGGMIGGKAVDNDPEIAVLLEESQDDARARTLALTENIVRQNLHPVDEYEAFAQLLDDGFSVEDVAARFALTGNQVRQRMALGALSPEIRDAWRKGYIDRDTAQAFTLFSSHAEQTKVFGKIAKSGPIWSGQVRSAAGVDYEAAKALKIVGVDAYRAAGGAVVEDLFGDNHAIGDVALVRRLLAEKIEARCAELVADGWSFAVPKSSVKNFWEWPRLKPKTALTAAEKASKAQAQAVLDGFGDRDFDDLEAEDQAAYDGAERAIGAAEYSALMRAFKPELRKTSGCIVVVGDGVIEVEYGVQKPASAKQATRPEKSSSTKSKGGAGSDGPECPEEPAQISNAMIAELSALRTVIAADAIAARPALALALAVASLEGEDAFGPVRLDVRGYAGLAPEDYEPRDFVTLFREALDTIAPCDLSGIPMLDRLAKCISMSIDMRVANASADTASADAIVAAIPADAWRSLALDRFDPATFFSRVPTPVIRAAIVEMGGTASKGKKSELADMAANLAKAKGWLPLQLRHPSEGAA